MRSVNDRNKTPFHLKNNPNPPKPKYYHFKTHQTISHNIEEHVQISWPFIKMPQIKLNVLGKKIHISVNRIMSFFWAVWKCLMKECTDGLCAGQMFLQQYLTCLSVLEKQKCSISHSQWDFYPSEETSFKVSLLCKQKCRMRADESVAWQGDSSLLSANTM